MSGSNFSRRAVGRAGLGLAAGVFAGQASAGGRPSQTSAGSESGPSCPEPEAAVGGRVRLDTPLGALIGSANDRAGQRVLAFKGIPYAVPPTGERRWKPAIPAPAWNCTRDATAFSPHAVQVTEPDTTFYSFPQSVQSEDCLYLNVWTPGVPAASKPGRPVMVWIHGGAFMNGAGSIPVYDGAELARKGVVVVTINYRLGIFGYYTHPDIITEAGEGICANFGTTDQIEALRWVRDNIAAFGGDPDQVTIFGESAGSMSVCQLLASPLAKGLFHRAIGQSGGYFYPMQEIGKAAWGGPSAEASGAIFARKIGAPSLADLRKLSAQELLLAAAGEAELLHQQGATIVVDGKVFDRQIHEKYLKGEQHAVPVLLGFNADEGSGIADYGVVPSISDPIAYEVNIRRRYGSLADEFLALYPASDPQTSAFDAFRDDGFGWHMMEWADLMSKVSSDTFFYHFTHSPPGANEMRRVGSGPNKHRIGAFHASEIAYTFNNMHHKMASVWADGLANSNQVSGPTHPVDVRLADIMSDYWVAFASNGAPTAVGQPAWLAYKSASGHYMKFGPEAKMSKSLLPGMWPTWSAIMKARRASGGKWYFGDEGVNGPVITARIKRHG